MSLDRPVPDRFRPVLTSLAKVIDASVVLVLLLALCVFAFGGFREFVGGFRLSVRSADRLLLLALLLTTVRHIVVRRPTMFETWREGVRRVTASEAFRAAWPAFISTRAAVLIVGYLAVVTFGIVPGSERFRVSDHELENLLARWDAQWYLSIVQEGYQWNGNRQIEQNVVFFPAFPTAIRVVGPWIGEQWLLAGLLLALAAFLLALAYVFRLARSLLPHDRAQYAVWLLAAYPFAVYYSAPYTEAFYLLGAVATFFHVERRDYWKAAAWGCFLALCRPNGFFIALPVAIVIAGHVWRDRQITLARVMACVAPGLGVLAYTGFLYVRFGDGLVWMKGQAAWGRVFVGVGAGLHALVFDRVNVVLEGRFGEYLATNPYDFIHSCGALFMIASLWPCARRFGVAYAVFVMINIFPPLLMGGMMSIGRMTSVLFPPFLWLAAALPQRYLPAVVAAFALAQGLVAALFFTWRPVF